VLANVLSLSALNSRLNINFTVKIEAQPRKRVKKGKEVRLQYHICTRLLVYPIPREASVRHVLLIQAPRNSLLIK